MVNGNIITNNSCIVEIFNDFFVNVQILHLEYLNKNKSLGPYSIPVKILQNLGDVLKQPLTYLINLSFQQGIFPEALKTAIVTPIFKKEDPQLSF